MLYREAFAASFTAALQYRAAAPRAHPLAEAVHLFSAAIVGLKRALHLKWPLNGKRTSRLRASECTESQDSGSIRKAVGPRAVRGSKIFVARPRTPRVHCAGREGRERDPSHSRSRSSPTGLPARRRALFTRIKCVVSILKADIPFSGRNGCDRCPLRPDSFVDSSVDKRWTPCVWWGMA